MVHVFAFERVLVERVEFKGIIPQLDDPLEESRDGHQFQRTFYEMVMELTIFPWVRRQYL
jgi:hypothetical protein